MVARSLARGAVDAADVVAGARLQNLLRGINERILELGWDKLPTSAMIDFICECSLPDCWRSIALTSFEYESVRSSPIRFALFPGHEQQAVELVVERHPRYVVVENVGEAASIAAKADPRYRSQPDPLEPLDFFEIRVERPADGRAVVALSGECDLAGQPELGAALDALIDGGHRSIVVDLSETTFVDSSLVDALVAARERLEAGGGGHIEVITDNRQFRTVFEVTGLERVVTIRPPLEDGVAG
jgi:anti-sigma B factor antagonist